MLLGARLQLQGSSGCVATPTGMRCHRKVLAEYIVHTNTYIDARTDAEVIYASVRLLSV